MYGWDFVNVRSHRKEKKTVLNEILRLQNFANKLDQYCDTKLGQCHNKDFVVMD